MKRLDAILSGANIASRSEIRIMAAKGRIAVNGVIIKDPSAKTDENSEITVDGKKIVTSQNVYIMINKPSGYICENDAPSSVLTLVPENLVRRELFTVGRLDKDTTGLLIISNDGAFGHSVISPKKLIEKEYVAKTELPIKKDDIRAFESGLKCADGTVFRPAKLEITDDFTAHVTVTEGKYHEVKRLFELCGNKVTELERIRIGSLFLDNSLKRGECREITEEEKKLLFVNVL